MGKRLLLFCFLAVIQVTAQNINTAPLSESPGSRSSNSQRSIIFKTPTEAWVGALPGQYSIPIIEEGHNKIIGGIVEESKKHIGTPYRSGCTGTDHFDCSGFMKFLFGRVGIKMNASSSEQYKQGNQVKNKDLKAGDLVFFKGSNSRSKAIGHVGMVVEADNEMQSFRFIHATVSYGVMIDDYPDGGYYSQRYVGARRIITEAGRQ